MQIVKNSLAYLAKLFTASIILSVCFFLAYERTTVFLQPIAHFLMFTFALVIFQGCNVLFCRSVFFDFEKTSSFLYAVMPSYAVFVIVSAILYKLRLSEIFNYIFLPMRFLEPITVSPTLSMSVAHLISLAVIFFSGLGCARRIKPAYDYDEEF